MKSTIMLSLATYRASKLVIDDEILREPREKVLHALYKDGSPAAEKVAYLLQCPWCVSIWVAGGFLLLRKLSPSTAKLLEEVLVASAVTGALHTKVG